MRVIIYGATGNTGLCCVRAAIKYGHSVTAFVRDANKLPQELASQVSVVVGNTLNKEDIRNSLNGQEAVVVALGTRNDLSPTTDLSDSLKNISSAMQETGVQRISICVSAFLFWERSKVPEKYHPLTADHEKMVETIKASPLAWTVVNPPHITEEPGKGNYLVELNKGPGRTISKHDLGDFLVKSLDMSEYSGQVCGICDSPQ